MVHLTVETLVRAPIDLCFDLARNMKLHAESMEGSDERIVRCPESGLLELGDEVEFEARHLGIRQRLSSKIIQYERPLFFTDEMVQGAFKRLRHEHRFQTEGEFTRMLDVIEFEAPAGVLGRLAERLLLAQYMRRVLTQRAQRLKQMAERAFLKQNS